MSFARWTTAGLVFAWALAASGCGAQGEPSSSIWTSEDTILFTPNYFEIAHGSEGFDGVCRDETSCNTSALAPLSPVLWVGTDVALEVAGIDLDEQGSDPDVRLSFVPLSRQCDQRDAYVYLCKLEDGDVREVSAQIVEGRLESLEAVSLPLGIGAGGSMELEDVFISAHLLPDGSGLEKGLIEGVYPVRAAAQAPNWICDFGVGGLPLSEAGCPDQFWVLEELPETPHLPPAERGEWLPSTLLDWFAQLAQPDVDRDGDGLERFWVSEQGRVERCMDGTSVDVPSVNPDHPWSCAIAPSINDGFSVAVNFVANREPIGEGGTASLILRSNAGLEGVVLDMTQPAGGDHSRTSISLSGVPALTDELGRFRFEKQFPGHYTVTVRRGYELSAWSGAIGRFVLADPQIDPESLGVSGQWFRRYWEPEEIDVELIEGQMTKLDPIELTPLVQLPIRRRSYEIDAVEGTFVSFGPPQGVWTGGAPVGHAQAAGSFTFVLTSGDLETQAASIFGAMAVGELHAASDPAFWNGLEIELEAKEKRFFDDAVPVHNLTRLSLSQIGPNGLDLELRAAIRDDLADVSIARVGQAVVVRSSRVWLTGDARIDDVARRPKGDGQTSVVIGPKAFADRGQVLVVETARGTLAKLKLFMPEADDTIDVLFSTSPDGARFGGH